MPDGVDSPMNADAELHILKGFIGARWGLWYSATGVVSMKESLRNTDGGSRAPFAAIAQPRKGEVAASARLMRESLCDSWVSLLLPRKIQARILSRVADSMELYLGMPGPL